MTLPEPVPGRITLALASMTKTECERLEDRLVARNALGEWETSADYLATVLGIAGHHVSATTIRNYRRALVVRQSVGATQ